MKIEQINYTEEDLDKLKDTFPGLDSFNLALVWEFSEHLLRLQSRIEQHEKAKKN